MPTHRGLIKVCKLDYCRRELELHGGQSSGNCELKERLSQFDG